MPAVILYDEGEGGIHKGGRKADFLNELGRRHYTRYNHVTLPVIQGLGRCFPIQQDKFEAHI